jgi:hypothetical protein
MNFNLNLNFKRKDSFFNDRINNNINLKYWIIYFVLLTFILSYLISLIVYKNVHIITTNNDQKNQKAKMNYRNISAQNRDNDESFNHNIIAFILNLRLNLNNNNNNETIST